MALHSEVELNNTREKLRRLEEQYERSAREPAENEYVRKLSLASLKRWINRLKEEIARYEAHAGTTSDAKDRV